MLRPLLLAAASGILLSTSCTASPAGDGFGETETGFVNLFDGETLSGWTDRGGRYDGDARWTVENGELVGRTGPNGEGGLLYTERSYANFVIRLETKIDHPFDSGVFVRMVPPERKLKGAQVTLDYRPGGEICAIYADGFLEHNEAAIERWHASDWNDVEVEVTGFDMRIRVRLNGELVTDHQIPPGTPGYASTGLIGVQVHGSRDDPPGNAARFRNVRIKELLALGTDLFEPIAEGSELLRTTEAARASGWRSLFDGESLDGWEMMGPRDKSTATRVRDGVLEFLPSKQGGQLVTEKDYTDFELRLDFKLSKLANSGVFLRGRRDGSDPAYSGCEIQVLDDPGWDEYTQGRLQPWQFCGSLYGAVANPLRSALRPRGEWNTYEILYRGSRVAVALNGHALYDVDTHTLEGAKPPFAERVATGFLGLQLYVAPKDSVASSVWYRNLFVRELD